MTVSEVQGDFRVWWWAPRPAHGSIESFKPIDAFAGRSEGLNRGVAPRRMNRLVRTGERWFG